MSFKPDDLGMSLGDAVGVPSPFPADPKKIRSRIKSYERKLRKEEEVIGCYDDGAGKRFLLGHLYMLMSDLEGALAHYDWYEREFPDDGAEPYNHLTWALTLRRGDREMDAFHRLYQTMLENLYLVPHLLGDKPEKLDFEGGSNYTWHAYALAIPQGLLDLWSEEDRLWARSVHEDPRVVDKRDRFIEIERQLDTEPRGPKRTALVKEARALQEVRLD